MNLILEESRQLPRVACLLLLGFTFFLEPAGVSAINGAEIPIIEDCQQITMRDSGGWWLSIKHDGAASYGFGTLPAQIQVSPHTFSFEDIHAQARSWINQPENSASTRYLAISFYRFSESAAIEHRSSPVVIPLTKLFNRAHEHSILPEHELDRLAHERINSFWSKSPPVSP